MADKEEKKQEPVKKGKTFQAHKLYEISGSELKRKNKSCPKCGKGYYLAQHKDRLVCGKCGYTEFTKKEKKK